MGEFWFLETMLDTLFAKMIDFRFLKTMQNFTILIIDFIQLTYTNFGADRNDEGEPLFTTSIKWDIFSTLEGIRYLQILHEISIFKYFFVALYKSGVFHLLGMKNLMNRFCVIAFQSSVYDF